MKTFAIVAGTLATVVTAAPAGSHVVKDKRTFPAGNSFLGSTSDSLNQQLNGYVFNHLDLSYVASINPLDLNRFENLGINNKLDVLSFSPLFNSPTFDLNSLLQLQQLSTLLGIASTGILDSFDLSTLPLGGLNLGLLGDPLAGLNLGSLLDPSLVSQILPFAQSLIDPLSPSLVDPFGGLLSAADPISALLGGSSDPLSALLGGSAGGDPISALLSGLGGAGGGGNPITDLLSGLTGGAGGSADPIGDLLSGIGGADGLTELLSGLSGGDSPIGDLLNGVLGENPLAGLLGGDSGENSTDGLLEQPVAAVTDALNPVLNTVGDVIKPVTDALDPVTDLLGPLIQGLGLNPLTESLGIE